MVLHLLVKSGNFSQAFGFNSRLPWKGQRRLQVKLGASFTSEYDDKIIGAGDPGRAAFFVRATACLQETCLEGRTFARSPSLCMRAVTLAVAALLQAL
jgi:hypothetical protein